MKDVVVDSRGVGRGDYFYFQGTNGNRKLIETRLKNISTY